MPKPFCRFCRRNLAPKHQCNKDNVKQATYADKIKNNGKNEKENVDNEWSNEYIYLDEQQLVVGCNNKEFGGLVSKNTDQNMIKKNKYKEKVKNNETIVTEMKEYSRKEKSNRMCNLQEQDKTVTIDNDQQYLGEQQFEKYVMSENGGTSEGKQNMEFIESSIKRKLHEEDSENVNVFIKRQDHQINTYSKVSRVKIKSRAENLYDILLDDTDTT